MMKNSMDQVHQAKQEGDPKESKLTKASSTSRHWASFRNPRIVRVSRSFGGKDRHSKVCTIRGLRDRRIRLSVPTAIQLYDLQDRLGLSQPSKVVDWLLDATKSDIDKLPPLQMPPGNFSQFFQPLGVSQQSSSASAAAPPSSLPHFFTSSYLKEGIKINDHHGDGNDQAMMERLSKYWNPHGDRKMQAENKDKWIPSSEQQNHEGFEGYNASQHTAQSFFPIANQSSFPNLFTNALPYNSFYQLEASNLSLSQFGTNNPISSNQPQDQISSHVSSLPFGSHQLYFPTIINPSLPSYTSMESSSSHDPTKQINHFQVLSSTSQHLLQNPLLPTLHFISSPTKSPSLNMNPKILHPQENEGRSSS